MKIKGKLFKKRKNVPQKKFYELIYIIEKHQEKKLAELAERFRKINGWSEKEMLQFAVMATNETDLNMKFEFLERLITDLENGEGMEGHFQQ